MAQNDLKIDYDSRVDKRLVNDCMGNIHPIDRTSIHDNLQDLELKFVNHRTHKVDVQVLVLHVK
jgi:hypothetical protein